MTMRTEVHVESNDELKITVRYFETFATVAMEIRKDEYQKVHSMTYFINLDKIDDFLDCFRMNKIEIGYAPKLNDGEDK
jgi:hypothetical protein